MFTVKMKYLILIIAIVTFGCNSSEENILIFNDEITFIEKFPKEISLEFKKFIDYPDGTILKLSENDSGLYMLDIKAMNNHLIHYFSKKEEKFLKEIIRRGNGPFESFTPYSIDFTTNKILLSDFEMRKIIEIDLLNFENGNTELKLEAYYGQIKYYNDSTYIATSSSPSSKKFHFINKKNGELQETKGEFKNIPTEIKLNQIPNFFQSSFGVNLKLNKVVNAYRWMDIIEIFDINTDKSMYIRSPINIKNKLINDLSGEISLERGGDAKECFVDIAYSDDYIYGLFSGNEDNLPEAYLSNIIYVFDWDGNPIKQLNLNRKVMSISVNQNDKRIYSFDLDAGEVIYLDL